MEINTFSLRRANDSRRMMAYSFAVIALVFGLAAMPKTTFASNPTMGTVNPNGTYNFGNPLPTDGKWMGTTTLSGAPNGESDCTTLATPANPTGPCDGFILNVSGNPSDWVGKQLHIRIAWTVPGTDYDLSVHKGSVIGGTTVGTSGNANTTDSNEDVIISPSSIGTGPYYINAIYYAGGGTGNQYTGTAIVESLAVAAPPPPSTCVTGTYGDYKPPTSLQYGSGEPSIGVNWNTGNVLYMCNLHILQAKFDDTNPTNPIPTWREGNLPRTVTTETLDPIMFTDPVTGRTFPGQLAGGDSLSAITDDDGLTTVPSLAGGIGAGVDHQTIGGGPFAPGITGRGPTSAYPHAVYYASQQIAFANLSLSTDGGYTFLPAQPMYALAGTAQTGSTLGSCGGLHGHLTIATDGTVYLPNKNCTIPTKGQGMAVSTDNGMTFQVRTVPGSTAGASDPAVASGSGGRIYFAYSNGDRHMRVATSDDKGVTWKYDQDLGLNVEVSPGVTGNIIASVYPQAIGGDNDRAEIFFEGTAGAIPLNGNPVGDDTTGIFAGTWYNYVATTCNGGQSWSVVRVGDPVQQGVICTNGTTCPSGTRNLLDFAGIVADRRGRAIAGYADGCTTASCTGQVPNSAGTTKASNNGSAVPAIIRQTGGTGLFAAFDTAATAPVTP